MDDIMQFLAGCGFFPRVEIGVLVGKCLVTISENRVHVHSLIYKVGLKIIKDQTDEIGMRYRFLDASNIQSLLEDNEIREDGEPEAISEPVLLVCHVLIITSKFSSLSNQTIFFLCVLSGK